MIKAEYIWIDGTDPTPRLRSKTRILESGDSLPALLDSLPQWSFDGSSTNQAEGSDSDCLLNPVWACHDPLRGGRNILVLCDVYVPGGLPHSSNKRYDCENISAEYEKEECWFGLEQEYTFMSNGRPLGFPRDGYPDPQGPYYCSVGASNAHGRQIVEEHLDLCLQAGLKISGINAEVMPGQWEFQVGPLGPLMVSDQLWVARYLLERVAEKYGVTVSWEGKPMKGDWNGAGCHTNFSTIAMRTQEGLYEKAAEALRGSAQMHISNYGHGIEERLTGLHETCSHEDFRWGVSDRGASVRIPLQVAREGVGYIEDRRPNANCDPYLVTTLITHTICKELRGE